MPTGNPSSTTIKPEMLCSRINRAIPTTLRSGEQVITVLLHRDSRGRKKKLSSEMVLCGMRPPSGLRIIHHGYLSLFDSVMQPILNNNAGELADLIPMDQLATGSTDRQQMRKTLNSAAKNVLSVKTLSLGALLSTHYLPINWVTLNHFIRKLLTFFYRQVAVFILLKQCSYDSKIKIDINETVYYFSQNKYAKVSLRR